MSCPGRVSASWERAAVLLGSRGFAHEKEDEGHEDDNLEDEVQQWKHFGFPSPLRIAPDKRRLLIPV